MDNELEPYKPQSLEAAKMLADVTKWVSTVETAILASMGLITKIQDPLTKGQVHALTGVGVLFYLISLTSAARLLYLLPQAVQHLNPRSNVYRDTSRFSIEHLSGILFTTFALGTLLIGASLYMASFWT